MDCKSNTFFLKFDVDAHTMDVATLSATLMSLTVVMQEINRDVNPSATLTTKINSVGHASFWFEVSPVLATLPLISLATLSNANEIISFLSAILNLRKFLRGEKPSKIEATGDSRVITNVKGDITYIDNRIYNSYTSNPSINESLNTFNKALKEDHNIETITIEDQNKKPLYSATRPEFSELTDCELLSEALIRIQEREQLTLQIARVEFEKSSGWVFSYEGFRITARIDDNDYLLKIRNRRERFARGDQLLVDMNIHQEQDPESKIWTNKAYRIVKVHDHLPLDGGTIELFPGHSLKS